MFSVNKESMVKPEEALAGRSAAVTLSAVHAVNGSSMREPFPAGQQSVLLALGCFWGAERLFWQLPGVCVTAVGYAGGFTPNPSYEEVCSGRTGHTEVVLIAFDPDKIAFPALLKSFWEAHDPTQGMRQGNDRGSQYRSAIYPSTDEQFAQARQSMAEYQQALTAAGKAQITTEIRQAVPFYYAEEYHQQYLAKNPMGYCSLRGTGISCPLPPQPNDAVEPD